MQDREQIQPRPTVVNLRNCRTVGDFDLYIGRRALWQGVWLAPSPWANPFKIGEQDRRATVILDYEALIRHRLCGPTRSKWLAALREIGGKRLACWCAPAACHGHVLANFYAEFVLGEPARKVMVCQ